MIIIDYKLMLDFEVLIEMQIDFSTQLQNQIRKLNLICAMKKEFVYEIRASLDFPGDRN